MSSCWKKKLGKWDYEIRFVNDPEKPKQYIDGEKMKDIINLSERIKKVSKYAIPIWCWQCSFKDVHHAAVVCQTETLYYTVEKNGESVWITKSEEFEKINFVIDKDRSVRFRKLEEKEGANCTMADLKEYIDQKELDTPYSILPEKYNCRGFAERIFLYTSKDYLNLGNLFFLRGKYKKMNLEHILLKFITKIAFIILETEEENWLINSKKSKLILTKSKEKNNLEMKTKRKRKKMTFCKWSNNSDFEINDLREGTFPFAEKKNSKYPKNIIEYIKSNDSSCTLSDVSESMKYSWKYEGFQAKFIELLQDKKFVKFKTENWYWSFEKDDSKIWIRKSKQFEDVNEMLRDEEKEQYSMLQNTKDRSSDV